MTETQERMDAIRTALDAYQWSPDWSWRMDQERAYTRRDDIRYLLARIEALDKKLRLEYKRGRVRASGIERWWRQKFFDRYGRYMGGDHTMTPKAARLDAYDRLPPRACTFGEPMPHIDGEGVEP